MEVLIGGLIWALLVIPAAICWVSIIAAIRDRIKKCKDANGRSGKY